MSEDDTPVTAVEVQDEDKLNWKEISEALERLGHVQDVLKQRNVSLTSAARATLLSAMQLHLMEIGGDNLKAMILMNDFMTAAWSTVHRLLKKALETAVTEGKLQGSKISEIDSTNIKELLKEMERTEELEHSIPADQIASVLEVQQELANFIETLSDKYTGIALARAMMVMAQQFMMFDIGEELSAKAAFEEQSRLLWFIAQTNVENLLKAAAKSAEDGAPEGVPS